MALRIGFLTSGGDCQGLNPAMRGVAKALYEAEAEVKIFGFQDGYAGLMHSNYRQLKEHDFSGILTRGGTMLGTSRQPFKDVHEPLHPEHESSRTRLEAMVDTYQNLRLDCLVVLGGNGSQKTANLLAEEGLKIISLPKTIDNDLYGTEITFGFQSAVNIATQVVDGIHSTATSHGRVFIIELMGHKVGWLSLYAGIAGGADVILIPEIPYDPVAIAKALKKREAKKKRFSIIVIAEGAKTKEEAKLSKTEYKELKAKSKFTSVAYELAASLQELMVKEIRCTVPGHFQRGGSPSPYDRVLTTQLGVKAAELILAQKFGRMVAVINGKIDQIKLSEVAGKLKTVPLDHSAVLAARETGISFGDEE